MSNVHYVVERECVYIGENDLLVESLRIEDTFTITVPAVGTGFPSSRAMAIAVVSREALPNDYEIAGVRIVKEVPSSHRISAIS